MKLKKLTLASLVTVGASLVWAPSASQAATLGGTEIRNQSTATFVDAAGRPQVSTSNEVINIVADIYGFAITPDASGAGVGAPGTYAGATDTPALSQLAAPDNIVYYSYILTNNGNAPDTFQVRWINEAADDDIDPDSVSIYWDANGNGQVDPGDLLLNNTQAFAGTSTPTVNAGDFINLVVAVEVPSTATDGDELMIDIDGRSDGDNTETDEVSNFTVTTIAQGTGVLALYKAADVSTRDPGETITYTIEGSNTGTGDIIGREINDGTADFDGDTNNERFDLDGDGAFTEVAAGNMVGLVIIDELDTTYLDVTTIANYTESLANAELFYGNAADDFYRDAADVPGGLSNITQIAIFIPENATTNVVLRDGQAFRFGFEIDVAGTAAFTGLDSSVVIYNDALGYYNDGATDRSSESNDVQVVVDYRSSDVAHSISPYTFNDTALPGADTNIINGSSRAGQQHPEVDNTLANTYSLVANGDAPVADNVTPGAADAETTIADNRNAGEVVAFPLTVSNLGGTVDTYDIRIPAGTNNFGGDYTLLLYKADGITPLADTDGDSVADTGPITSGNFVDIVVKVFIDEDAAATTDAGDAVITATSSVSGSADSTLIEINNVRPAGVDIAVLDNGDADGTGTDSSDNNFVATAVQANATGTGDIDDTADGDPVIPHVITADPGGSATYSVEVRNVRSVYTGSDDGSAQEDRLTGAPDTYALTWTDPAADGLLAAGWKVNFYTGNTADASANPAISDTADLDPDEKTDLFITVEIPEGYTAGTYIIGLVATSENNSAISDTMYIAVTVNEFREILLVPDNEATLTPGGTFTFPHIVTNLGNTVEDISLTVTSANGYQVIFVDGEGTALGASIDESTSMNDASGNPIDLDDVAIGEDVPVWVRVFIPTNAPTGTVSVFTLTATGSHPTGGAYTDPDPTDDAVDIVRVIDGNLELIKSRDVDGDGTYDEAVADISTPVRPTPATADPEDAGADGDTRDDNIHPITYRTEFVNLGSDPVTDTIIVDAIPANTRLVVVARTNPAVAGEGRDSAAPAATLDTGTADIEVSTDGGVSWAAIATVTAGAAADGSLSTITHIRFVVNNTVGADDGVVVPNEGGTVTFDVLID